MKIHSILPASKANGPGTRYTLWVQGCSIHCKGCSNKSIWDPKAGREMSIDDLVNEIRSQVGLDGVTITGGEPFDQYDEVRELCRKLHSMISIFLITGYQWSKVKNFDIIPFLDIICTGPFVQSKLCKNQWRGSSNQRVIPLTDRGRIQLTFPIVSKEVYIYENGDSLRTGFTS